MRLSVPAKINLHLRVGPPRHDGFHPLLSWMCTVGLFDTLEVNPAPGEGITLACDAPDVPCDQRNLVVKTAAALAEVLAESYTRPAVGGFGLSMRLSKQIPVGAGLGGGSSDGAFTLLALNELWHIGWDRDRLADFAARFGSDLSFFFHAPSAICRGRGEVVCPISAPKPGWALLILPGRPMPTAAVYRRFDEMKLGNMDVIDNAPDFNGWAGTDALRLLPLLVNDLEPAAFDIDPLLGCLRADAEQTLGRIVRMSGSGNSLFTLLDGMEEAQAAEQIVRQRLGTKAVAVPLGPITAC